MSYFVRNLLSEMNYYVGPAVARFALWLIRVFNRHKDEHLSYDIHGTADFYAKTPERRWWPDGKYDE